ncbi:organic cation transporter-like protein [Haliotis asinina]|uniref:organic cation transporter-like protein n=1 Tax=Haliotis asinina TaxID=109174 RepID=UPI003531B9E0
MAGPSENHGKRDKSVLSAARDTGQLSVDTILERLGAFGRYQIIQISLLFSGHFSIAFQILNFVFIAQEVKHQCTSSGFTESIDGDVVYGQCKGDYGNISTNNTITRQCVAWRYESNKLRSIVSEWDLVCDDVPFSRLPQTMFIVGQGVGALIFSVLSDKFGRRPLLLLTHLLTAGFGVGQVFSPNIHVFTALRMIDGIFQQGLVVVSCTMVLELFPRRRRLDIVSINTVYWCVCLLILTLIAYLLRHHTWRTLQLVLSSGSIAVVFQIIFIDESLRWLIANKKDDKALQILNKASRFNCVDISTVIQQATILPETSSCEARPDIAKTPKASRFSVLDVFKNAFLLKISVIIWLTWLVDSLTYFSLYLTSSSLADNFYLNFLLNSLAEAPAGPLFWFVSRRYGRRRFFMIFHVLSGVSLLLTTILKRLADGVAASSVATAFAFVGKIGNSACFASMFSYVPELYPTNIRTVGLGGGSTAARIGAAISPFTSMVASAIPWLPGTIFGVGCLIIAGLVMILPESQGRELPETVEEIRAWPKSPRTSIPTI